MPAIKKMSGVEAGLKESIIISCDAAEATKLQKLQFEDPEV